MPIEPQDVPLNGIDVKKRSFWTRRKFMAALGGAVILLGGGAMLSRQRIMAWRIHSHFSYLKIKSGDALRFVRAYEDAYGELPYHRRSVSDVYKKFLLSTDFFSNGSDESKPVRFVMLYDPYLSLCYNPLKSSLET